MKEVDIGDWIGYVSKPRGLGKEYGNLKFMEVTIIYEVQVGWMFLNYSKLDIDELAYWKWSLSSG